MGTLAMNRKERARVAAFARVRDGGLTVAAAARELGLSPRQARRAWKRYVAAGDAGLVHRLRGRTSNHAGDADGRAAALRLYRARYAGFGPTLAAEYLARDDGLAVTHDTLGRWLRAAGLFEPRRKRAEHRQRRPRRGRAG